MDREEESLHSPDDDADIWTSDKSDPPQLEFRGNPGFIIPDDVKSPGDFFRLFLTESLLNKIVQESNRYAAPQIAKSQFKINLISQHFNETMDRIYKSGRKLCIDEAIVVWRGRLVFRQYIKNKRHKYGIKLYELCEPDGIILRVKIYAGKYDDLSGRNHTSNVILALMDDFLNRGHELYMDNYYNSVGLAKDLTSKSTYVCGALRFDRKGNPKDLVKKKLNRGDSEWLRSGSIVVNK
ncbi:PREDICTED: uncharacterized protein LOC108549141 [Eufriesea mexicana]|uniref:uncharacterized protein LOC108549141 n=1 Tax=Eufriesea mexicana TaxID=516756 RepID=UPI00083C645C|nr:PREDICTED: uncharacterized protein LOC108549141 [Eufriesea mexicana]